MAPYVGILRAAGLAKETVVGTAITTPTEYIPYIPPDGFSPDITTLESKGVRAQPDMVVKASQGPGVIKGGKVKFEVEPENCGNVLMAAFGTDTKTGDASTGYLHTFTRLANAQLPTYTWWFDKGAKFPIFAGCMLSKLDLDIKAKEFVTIDSEWTGLSYNDTGTSKTPAYSALKAWKFAHAAVSVDTVANLNYDNIKVTIDNKVSAEHALSGSIYTSKIWSEGMRVTISADLFFEDSTQYAKFLAGTTAAFQIVLTGTDDIAGATAGVKATLTIDLPEVRYTAAPLHNASGVLKVPFAGVAVYNVATTKTASIALRNSVATAY